MKIVGRMPVERAGTILLLNGASSAGKSSIARCLQRQLPGAWLHVQLDAFRAMEPAGYFVRGQPDISATRLAALCRAINATAAEYALHGQNVLLDHALSDEAWTYLVQDLAAFRVLLVGVHCSMDTLAERERRRGDRPLGLAASQFDRMHQGRDYDYQVDTTHQHEEACAAELARWLGTQPAPRAFDARVARASQEEGNA